jgi:tRNA A-37 threonylcarbamoyl transferase component Bud32
MADEDREQRLDQVIADYLAAQDAGIAPARDALLAADPDLAEDLRSFFREHDRLGRLAAPLRAGVEPTPSRESESTLGSTISSSSPFQGTIDYDAERGAPTPPDATMFALPGGNGAPMTRGSTVRYFGDYEIQKEVGRGGMGVVYKARQVSLNRPVALKMIKAGVLADDAELRRFHNEAKAVALLDHPGIVSVYEVGEHDGQCYLSMKLIDGGNLGDQIASFRDNPRAAVTMMIEAAEAVQHAHMRGILHRDLKPANILVDAVGHLHITDFGLAKLMQSNVDVTASGAIIGTPAYMSPEQAAGHRGRMSLATDVYGLGAIFYALLTGKSPFGGDNVIGTLEAVRNRLPEVPRKRNARIPRDLELICLKCLEKNPADRYPTAGALVDDLRRWAAGEPVSVRAAGIAERVAKWARRKPTLAAAYTLGLLSLLFGGLGGAAVWQWRAAARARDVAATAKEATGRLNVQLRRAFDEQKQLVDQFKQLANEKTTLAERAGTARDSLVAMINDLINQVASDPNRSLSEAVLTRKLNELSEKTKIEFDRVFVMIGD